jgi:hypothetical protein
LRAFLRRVLNPYDHLSPAGGPPGDSSVRAELACEGGLSLIRDRPPLFHTCLESSRGDWRICITGQDDGGSSRRIEIEGEPDGANWPRRSLQMN